MSYSILLGDDRAKHGSRARIDEEAELENDGRFVVTAEKFCIN